MPSENTIIGGVRSWLRGCPLIRSRSRLNVNYLGSKPVEYVVEDVPSSPVVESYADGSSLRLKNFIVASRDTCGPDVTENLVASGFWDQLIDWIEEQDAAEAYPSIGHAIHSVGVTSTGYTFELDGSVARYQIQIQLLYYKEGS